MHSYKFSVIFTRNFPLYTTFFLFSFRRSINVYLFSLLRSPIHRRKLLGQFSRVSLFASGKPDKRILSHFSPAIFHLERNHHDVRQKSRKNNATRFPPQRENNSPFCTLFRKSNNWKIGERKSVSKRASATSSKGSNSALRSDQQ